MASSSGEDIPRGLGFLLSRNRLNVAVSRAQALAYLVCSPRLLEVDCRTIPHMRLANALCRFAELAQGMNPYPLRFSMNPISPSSGSTVQSRIDRKVEEFAAAYTAGDRIELAEFTSGLAPDERQVLLERLEEYVARAPRRRFHAKAYTESRVAQIVEDALSEAVPRAKEENGSS
jgi:hypothetical protein